MYESVNMTQPEFLTKYIRPFYMDLMKMNFVSKSDQHTNKMINQIKILSEELNDETLSSMLNDAWRPSKVGAWMIGLGNRTNLTLELEKYLKKTPSDYVEHVLFNYYLIKKEFSKPVLIEFIQTQLNYYKKQTENVEFDNLSIHWSLALLSHIDEVNKETNVNKVKSTEWWNEAIEFIKNKRHGNLSIELLANEYYVKTIKEAIRRIETDDNK